MAERLHDDELPGRNVVIETVEPNPKIPERPPQMLGETKQPSTRWLPPISDRVLDNSRHVLRRINAR